MSKTITQTITFKNSTPEILYGIYTDSKKHSAATGGKAVIKNKIGTKFSSWDGYITGVNLHLVAGKTIIQTWRSADFKSIDTDSILILNFSTKGNDTVVEMIHANVPDKQAAGLKKGWNDFYWKPWEKYLNS